MRRGGCGAAALSEKQGGKWEEADWLEGGEGRLCADLRPPELTLRPPGSAAPETLAAGQGQSEQSPRTQRPSAAVDAQESWRFSSRKLTAQSRALSVHWGAGSALTAARRHAALCA